MLVLTIDNSECRLEGLTLAQHKALKEVLFYTTTPQMNYYSGSFHSDKKYLIDKFGRFPTGLLYIVYSHLKESKLNYTTMDKRILPKRQEGVVKAILTHSPYLEQVEAAEAVRRFNRGIVVAPTGFGKSVIIALIIQELQVPTLIVVPSLELKRQLTETMQSTFTKEKVGKGKFINVENIDSLDPTKPAKGYDCVIIDEFHHSGAKTYRQLNKKSWNGVYYKVGLTATPFRSQDNEKLLLESVLSQVIYRVEYQTAVKQGYIVPMEAYYVELPKTKVNLHSWPEVYSKLVVNNDSRNNIISRLIRTLCLSHISVLTLVKEIRHGNILSELSTTHFANGENEDTKDLIRFFNDSKIKALIGTTGVLGEGVDTRPAEFIIIAGLGKSKNAFMQQVGRGFRRHGDKESCKIILIKDDSHKFTKAHYKEQVKILREEYGIEPVKLILPTEDKS